jgi:alpha-glucosidase
MEAYQDGVNAGRMAGDYKLVKSQVNSKTRMKIHLAEGGGWAARIHP